MNPDGQIAFDADGNLVAVVPIVEGGTHSATYTVDQISGTLIPIDDDIIIIDPFADIAGGSIF
jgi:hypothetical protein